MASMPTSPRMGLGMRRVSIETISEPFLGTCRRCFLRQIRHRFQEEETHRLKSIPEEKSETKVVGDEGPLHDPHATSSSSAAATAGSGVPPSGHLPLVLILKYPDP